MSLFSLLTSNREISCSIFEKDVSRASTLPVPWQQVHGSLIINVTLGRTCPKHAKIYIRHTKIKLTLTNQAFYEPENFVFSQLWIPSNLEIYDYHLVFDFASPN